MATLCKNLRSEDPTLRIMEQCVPLCNLVRDVLYMQTLIKNGYVPLIHCKLQSVFYDATSWLQDTGVLQKMDDDIWMLYGKRTGEKTHITTTRVLSIKETSLPFALCFLGLIDLSRTFADNYWVFISFSFWV